MKSELTEEQAKPLVNDRKDRILAFANSMIEDDLEKYCENDAQGLQIGAFLKAAIEIALRYRFGKLRVTEDGKSRILIKVLDTIAESVGVLIAEKALRDVLTNGTPETVSALKQEVIDTINAMAEKLKDE